MKPPYSTYKCRNGHEGVVKGPLPTKTLKRKTSIRKTPYEAVEAYCPECGARLVRAGRVLR